MDETAPLLRPVNPPRSANSSGKRAYSEAFKRDAVEQARGGKSVAQVARSLGVARATLRAWIDSSPPAPLSMLEAVRSGNRRKYLQRARDHLAAAIDGGVPARELLPSMRMLEEFMRELDDLDDEEEDD